MTSVFVRSAVLAKGTDCVREIAMRQLGTVFWSGPARTVRFLSVREPLFGVGATSAPRMAPRVVQYLTIVVPHQRGAQITICSERDLRTSAAAMDSMLAGELARCGDVLMQRFSAVAAATEEMPWIFEVVGFVF